ncbi:MAG: hypothetical protein ACREQ5_27900, partial [Candidatus Dormibacteria bacterium]
MATAAVELESGSQDTAPTPIRRYRQARPGSPYHQTFKDDVLSPLAARAWAGEDRQLLVDELHQALRPWTEGLIVRRLAALPAHVDRAETHSQLEETVLLACWAIDFSRWQAWPSLLRRRVQMAPAEAARREDWLTRRQRRYRKLYLARLSMKEQELGRHLAEHERVELAAEIAPASNRVAWSEELVRGLHPQTMGDMPDAPDTTSAGDPEGLAMREADAEIITTWLRSLPPPVHEQLLQWLPGGMDHSRPLPHR